MVVAILADIVQILQRVVNKLNNILPRIKCSCPTHIVFSTGTNTLIGSVNAIFTKENIQGIATFCEFTALFNFAKSDCGSTVPRKIDLNWFMPALVKRRVGSERGATPEEGTKRLNQPQISKCRCCIGVGVGVAGGEEGHKTIVGSLTKGMTILLEIIQESLSNFWSGPFRTIVRRHPGKRWWLGGGGRVDKARMEGSGNLELARKGKMSQGQSQFPPQNNSKPSNPH